LGTVVKVRGKVVKYSAQIMGKISQNRDFGGGYR